MPAFHAIGGYQVADDVLSAVRQASARTGVDFRYMMAKAAQESAFDPAARAATSSATGLYQFIDQTWLGMVKSHGARYGLEAEAAAIERTPGDRFAVDDPAMEARILALRTDPGLNAALAGEFAAGNAEHLAATVGGRIGPTELYLAHFLGAKGAERFLTAMRAAPERPAAEFFPAAARANRAVFEEAGRPRSLAEVHGWIDRRIDRAMTLAEAAPGGAGAGMPPVTGATGSAGGPAAAPGGAARWVELVFGPNRSAGPGRGTGGFAPATAGALTAPGGAASSLSARPLPGPFPGAAAEADLPGPSTHREDVHPASAAGPMGEAGRQLAERRLSLWTLLTTTQMDAPGE
ncbi:MAG: transglycosylase SLT domain-containing protein [Azospirillaceae bacterium]